MTLKYYTRQQCGLCKDGYKVIQEIEVQFPYRFEVCDIETNDEWTEKYGLMIPVVTQDEKILNFGRIHKDVILKRLQNE